MRRLFYPDFQRRNPFRKPDWRWTRAWELFNSGQYYSPNRDDVATSRALSFVRAEFGISTPGYRRRLMRRLGDVAAAHRIQGGPNGIRLEIEARILARQTAQQIGRRVGLPADVIVTFETLFCNIADRLDASTYISAVVIGEAVPSGTGKPDFASLIKWTAYNGGGGPLDAMLRYVAHKHEVEMTGSSSITLEPTTQLAIDAFVAAHTLQVHESTAFDIAAKGKIVQEILENRPSKRLLADVFAAQTAVAFQNWAQTSASGVVSGQAEDQRGGQAEAAA